MTHPVLVQALGTVRVIPQVRVPKPTERMVPSFVRSGERIHVLQLLQRLVQMATNYVRRRDGLFLSSTEKETSLAVANELLEKPGNRWVKIDLTKTVGRLEPLLDLAVTNLLFDVKGQEVGRDVFIDLDAQHLSDSQTRSTAQDKDQAFPWLLPPRQTRHHLSRKGRRVLLVLFHHGQIDELVIPLSR